MTMSVLQNVLGALFISAAIVACGSGSGRYEEPDDGAYAYDEESCVSENGRIAELESQLEEARSQLSALEDRKDQLQSAASELQDNVDRLASENWRDVIPDIDASADDVESESTQMEGELDEASTILEER